MRFASIILTLSATIATATPHVPKLERIPLLGKAIFTEGIAYSAKRNMFYVSSAVGGSIQTVDAASGKVQWFSEAGADGRAKALGLKVDEKRDRLWVAGNDGIYIFDLATSKLTKKVALASSFASSFLNDIALDNFGNAYVTDSFDPNLFRIDAETLTMTRFADMSLAGYRTKNGSP